MMITVGSISREQAAQIFPFLAEHYHGRRMAMREVTHGKSPPPRFIFWIFPDGRLHNADTRTTHGVVYPPRGYEHIAADEPAFGSILRGRVAFSRGGSQLIAVSCTPEALATNTPALRQLLTGLEQMPEPIHETALVISDNGDIYGTVADLGERASPAGE